MTLERDPVKAMAFDCMALLVEALDRHPDRVPWSSLGTLRLRELTDAAIARLDAQRRPLLDHKLFMHGLDLALRAGRFDTEEARDAARRTIRVALGLDPEAS